MDGEAIITVSAAVVTLTQLIKWVGLPDKWSRYVVFAISAFGVVLWGYTQTSPEMAFGRADIWSYFAGWIAVATSAAGVFGFTKAANEGVQQYRATRSAHQQARSGAH